VLVAAPSHAQTQAPFPQQRGSAVALKFSPLAAFDPTTSNLQAAAEWRFSPRYAIEVAYGAPFSALRIGGHDLLANRSDYKYRKYKVEFRRYLRADSAQPNRNIVLALQPFYIPQSYVRYNGFYQREGAFTGYDKAVVEKNVMGLAFKLGCVWRYGQHWLVEANGGVGARYMNVKYEMENPRPPANVTVRQANMFNQAERPGWLVNMHMEFGVKVGYMLELGRKS
jgi:hypothetical protein